MRCPENDPEDPGKLLLLCKGAGMCVCRRGGGGGCTSGVVWCFSDGMVVWCVYFISEWCS